jgi:hypothetical protein
VDVVERLRAFPLTGLSGNAKYRTPKYIMCSCVRASIVRDDTENVCLMGDEARGLTRFALDDIGRKVGRANGGMC